jgi:hypothetical protein
MSNVGYCSFDFSPKGIRRRSEENLAVLKQEATRKLEISQAQERELLKSQAIAFGQSSGIVARKVGETGEVGISAAGPAVLPN